MKTITRDILKGKNLDINLKKYITKMSSINYDYSAIKSAMNYYTYHEMLSHAAEKKDKSITDMASALDNIIKKHFEGKTYQAEVIDEIDKLRNEAIERMQVYNAFADRLNIYEYVLNRVEFRFNTFDMPADYSDENFAKKIMQYIFSTEENMVINQNIAEVVGQLPVRMTKVKFFELLNDGINVYSKATKGALDDFLYMLRTGAMLDAPANTKEVNETIWEICENLSEIDYVNITEAEYKQSMDKLQYASDYIMETVDLLVMFTELINDFYVMALLKENVQEDQITKASMRIIADVNKNLGIYNADDYDVMDDFLKLEGVQEKLSEESMLYDITQDILETIPDVTDNYRMALLTLKKVNMLTSSSIFIELKQDKSKDAMVDIQYLEKCKEKIFADLGNLFQKNGKYIKRAVMASILAGLPVFFNNINEIQEYVYASLDSCRDMAEKQACIQILEDIIG